MEIKEVKLKDICIDMHQGINTVADKVEYKDNGFPIIQSKNITSNYLDLDDVRYLDEDDYLKYKDKYNPKIGDILVCNIGTIGTSLVLKEDIEFLIAWNLFKLKVNTDLYNSSYIKYYLDRLKSMDYFDRLTTGGTVKFINKAKMGDIVVPVFSLETQNKIVEVLDKAQELIDKRKEQIEALDELVKSRFIEMFGDPVKNPKNWNMELLSEIGTLGRGVSKHRPRNAPELLGGDYPLIQTGDVANCGLYIKEYNATYSELGLKQSKLWDKGTLCITIAANIAKTGILEFDACFPDSVVGFIAGNKTNNIFMNYWFASFQKLLEEQAPESAQKNINLKILSELKVIMPPIELQNQFADFVKQIDKLKSQMETSLKELEDNFNSLMQKAFKGELF